MKYKGIDIDKLYELDELLETMSDIEIKEESLVYLFAMYIENNERFRYSKVTKYIYEHIKEDEQIIYILEENVNVIIAFIEKNEQKIKKWLNDNSLNLNYKNFKIKMEKLEDYILLETSRIDFNKEAEKEARDPFIKELNKEVDKVYKQFDQEAKETTKKMTKLESSLYTSVIAVLGIFTAFIASYFGGMNILGSILTYLHLSSKFRIVFIVLLIGMILFNITFVLLWFVSKMLKKDMGGKVPFSDINDYEDLKWYKKIRRFKLIKRVLKNSKNLKPKKRRKIVSKFMRKYNRKDWIKRVYFYHKVKFKRFPMLYILNLFCIIGMVGTVILKYLDLNNIFKF